MYKYVLQESCVMNVQRKEIMQTERDTAQLRRKKKMAVLFELRRETLTQSIAKVVFTGAVFTRITLAVIISLQRVTADHALPEKTAPRRSQERDTGLQDLRMYRGC